MREREKMSILNKDMSVSTVALLFLLAGGVCSSSKLCKPSTIHQPVNKLTCNPFRVQCSLALTCSVSGLDRNTHILKWHTTVVQHSGETKTGLQHTKKSGCSVMSATLTLVQPAVGEYWCALYSVNGTSLQHSRPFLLYTPSQYTHLPTCTCHTGVYKLAKRHHHHGFHRHRAKKDTGKGQEAVLTEYSGSGNKDDTDGGASYIIALETLPVVVVILGGVILFTICVVVGCVYALQSSRRRPSHIVTGSSYRKSTIEFENDNVPTSYVSFTEMQGCQGTRESEIFTDSTPQNENADKECRIELDASCDVHSSEQQTTSEAESKNAHARKARDLLLGNQPPRKSAVPGRLRHTFSVHNRWKQSKGYSGLAEQCD